MPLGEFLYASCSHLALQIRHLPSDEFRPMPLGELSDAATTLHKTTAFALSQTKRSLSTPAVQLEAALKAHELRPCPIWPSASSSRCNRRLRPDLLEGGVGAAFLVGAAVYQDYFHID